EASEFISYNTFAGVAAFSAHTTLGNALDGFLITSSGRKNVLRTNVIAENGEDGVEISGAAKGVLVSGTIIGANWDGVDAMGNAENGIEVAGNARRVVIGGPHLTCNIIPENTISGNLGNGVAVLNDARNVKINNSFIGIDVTGAAALGNGK